MTTKNNNPLLSIVLFTRNRKKELKNQINSIYSSNSEGNFIFNVFILDNSDKLNTDIPTYKNLKYIYNDCNLGLRGSLKKAFTICNGDFLWLLSDDDNIAQDAISKILEFITKNKDKSVILIDRKQEYKDNIISLNSKSYFSKIGNKEHELDNKTFINMMWNVPIFLSIIILKKNIFQERIKKINLNEVYPQTDLIWNFWFLKPFSYTSTFFTEPLVVDRLGEKVYSWDKHNHVGIVAWSDLIKKYSISKIKKYNAKLSPKELKTFYLSSNSYFINKLFRYGIRSILIISKNQTIKNELKNKYLNDFFYAFKNATTFGLKIVSLIIILFLLDPNLSEKLFLLLSNLFPNKKFSRFIKGFNTWYKNKKFLLEKGILPFSYEAS